MKKISIAVATVLISTLGLLSTLRADSPAIGSKAPDFTLTDTNGKPTTLSSFKGKTVVLEWTNYGCPFVVKHYGSNNMQSLQSKYTGQGVIWLSINSSAKGKEGNVSAAEWNTAVAGNKAASTAYLIDEDGKVGKTYGAKTTPHMFIVNAEGVLVYKGAIDDKPSTKQSDIATAKNYVSAALDEIAAGKKVSTSATESYGCSVKYAK